MLLQQSYAVESSQGSINFMNTVSFFFFFLEETRSGEGRPMALDLM